MKSFKIALFIAFISLGFGWAGFALGATEFISIVDRDNASGTDYTTLSAWEAATQANLTSAATQVFSGTLTSTIADNATVYLCRSGTYQTHSGTVVHANAAGNQILIESITGAATEQANDRWYTNITCNSAGYFTISNGGDSAIAVASCRSSGTADTTAVTINGWTTSASNYIKIWTDPSLGNRHNGKWDDEKYRLEYDDAAAIGNFENFVRLDGLQMYIPGGGYGGFYSGYGNTGATTDLRVSNNIIKSDGSSASYHTGIMLDMQFSASAVAMAWNNIVYDLGKNAATHGISTDNGTFYVYNNTVSNSRIGIHASGTAYAKNNIVQDVTNGYDGTFDASSNYNISSLSGDTTGGAQDKVNTTVSFVDLTNKDFHLAPSDTAAKGAGTNLYADANLAVTTDIDNSARPGASSTIPWDIGADQTATPIYRSVGPSATGALATGASNAMSISGSTATFALALADNIGVGDAIQYDDDGDGDIDASDSIAFITARASSTAYTVKKADGSVPTAISVTGTFGNTSTASADYDTVPVDAGIVDKFTLSVDGSVSKLTFRAAASSGTINVKGLIYANSGGNPGSIIATSNATSVSTSVQQRDLVFASPVSLAAGTYWLGIVSESDYISIRVDSSAGTGNIWRNVGLGYASPATPFGGSLYDSDYTSEIFATYTVTTDQDWSIFRAYSSLYAAERGNENDSIDDDLEDFDNWDGTGDYTDTDEVGRDIVANNEQWNIAAYANGTTADSTAVTIDGWTTGAQNYIKVYTPVSTSEVGTSQRHAGKWDDGKYRLEVTNNDAISNYESYVRYEGLQVKLSVNTSWGYLFRHYDETGETIISHNIFQGNATDTGEIRGIYFNDSSPNHTSKIYNNIIYGVNGGGSYGAIWIMETSYVYNNTLVNNGTGISQDNGAVVIAKNNIAQNCTDGYSGSFDSSSDYNISNVASDTTGGAHDKPNTTVQFVDAANNDFHLAPSDTAAIDAGVDLSNDANLAFSDDIDGESRAGAGTGWDIGADEARSNPNPINIKSNVNFKPGTVFKAGGGGT